MQWIIEVHSHHLLLQKRNLALPPRTVSNCQALGALFVIDVEVSSSSDRTADYSWLDLPFSLTYCPTRWTNFALKLDLLWSSILPEKYIEEGVRVTSSLSRICLLQSEGRCLQQKCYKTPFHTSKETWPSSRIHPSRVLRTDNPQLQNAARNCQTIGCVFGVCVCLYIVFAYSSAIPVGFMQTGYLLGLKSGKSI